MIKRIAALLLILAFAITAGCTKSDEPDGDTTVISDTQPSADGKTAVLDKDGSRIGEIDRRAVCTAVDGGIFYSISDLKEYQFTADTEYRFFDMDGKKDVSLGTLENQGYEASFARTDHNGKIYTLSVVGNATSGDPVPLLLLAFDPAAGTMKKYTVSENGFPYASMTVSDGKLIIMDHEMSEPKCDKIYEFDPGTETVREILTFSSDTDSLRAVCSADDGFFLLRLKINDGAENEMFLDRYDKNNKKVSETSVNETLVEAIGKINGMTGRQDALNELGTHVGGFSVVDGRFMIYENFSVTRLIVDLQSGDAILARDDIYSVSTGGGERYVYRMDFDPDNVEEPEIIGMIGGKPEKLQFTPSGALRLIRAVSHSPGGTWLVTVSDVFAAQKGTYALYLWADK